METKDSNINLAMSAEIKAEQNAQRLTAAQMVERTGLTLRTFNRIVSREPRDINVTQIDAIAAALGITSEDLVRRAAARAHRASMSEVAVHNVSPFPALDAEDTGEIEMYSGAKAAYRDDEADTDEQ